MSPLGLTLVGPMGLTVRPRKTSCTASAGGMPGGRKVARWKLRPSGWGGFHLFHHTVRAGCCRRPPNPRNASEAFLILGHAS